MNFAATGIPGSPFAPASAAKAATDASMGFALAMDAALSANEPTGITTTLPAASAGAGAALIPLQADSSLAVSVGDAIAVNPPVKATGSIATFLPLTAPFGGLTGRPAVSAATAAVSYFSPITAFGAMTVRPAIPVITGVAVESASPPVAAANPVYPITTSAIASKSPVLPAAALGADTVRVTIASPMTMASPLPPAAAPDAVTAAATANPLSEVAAHGAVSLPPFVGPTPRMAISPLSVTPAPAMANPLSEVAAHDAVSLPPFIGTAPGMASSPPSVTPAAAVTAPPPSNATTMVAGFAPATPVDVAIPATNRLPQATAPGRPAIDAAASVSSPSPSRAAPGSMSARATPELATSVTAPSLPDVTSARMNERTADAAPVPEPTDVPGSGTAARQATSVATTAPATLAVDARQAEPPQGLTPPPEGVPTGFAAPERARVAGASPEKPDPAPAMPPAPAADAHVPTLPRSTPDVARMAPRSPESADPAPAMPPAPAADAHVSTLSRSTPDVARMAPRSPESADPAPAMPPAPAADAHVSTLSRSTPDVARVDRLAPLPQPSAIKMPSGAQGGPTDQPADIAALPTVLAAQILPASTAGRSITPDRRAPTAATEATEAPVRASPSPDKESAGEAEFVRAAAEPAPPTQPAAMASLVPTTALVSADPTPNTPPRSARTAAPAITQNLQRLRMRAAPIPRAMAGDAVPSPPTGQPADGLIAPPTTSLPPVTPTEMAPVAGNTVLPPSIGAKTRDNTPKDSSDAVGSTGGALPAAAPANAPVVATPVAIVGETGRPKPGDNKTAHAVASTSALTAAPRRTQATASPAFDTITTPTEPNPPKIGATDGRPLEDASTLTGGIPAPPLQDATPRLISATLNKAPAIAADVPVVTAQPGKIGHEVGVEIARRISAGGEELVVRLDPAELGRIEVRMSFDERGGLRAVIAADSPVALDMLRRDSADLSRSLSDAGVRSDAQSLRFQNDGGGNGGQPRSPWLAADPKSARQGEAGFADEFDSTPYRPVRTSGRYDLLA